MKNVISILICSLLILPLFGQEKYAGGLEFDDMAYEGSAITVPLVRDVTAARLPTRASLKAYAPTPQNQGQYNNCVGWSSAYAARTIMYNKARNITGAERVDAHAFSPAFTYRLISTDNSCFTPTSIEHALRSLKEKGAVRKNDFDYHCSGSIPGGLYAKAKSFQIESYSRLFFLKDPEKLKLISIKNAIAEGNPVIIGMKCTPSFERSDGQEVWSRTESTETKQYFGHAMCVVGYDNKKFGGAFEIMNSWGQRWGKGGFIWVKYKDFIHFAKYAYLPIGKGGNLPIASVQKPKGSNKSTKSSSKAYTSVRPKPTNTSANSRPSVPEKSSTQFGYTSSELLELAGEIKLLKSNGEEMPVRLYGNLYRTKSLYAPGTKFKLQLSSIKNAYVYVLGIDTRFRTLQLFPSANGGNPFVNGGSQTIDVPGKKKFIQLDTFGGDRDYLCVIYSEEPLDPSNIQKSISNGTGSLSARVQRALGSKAISPRNIQYESGRVAFSSLKDPGMTLSLIIETRRQK